MNKNLMKVNWEWFETKLKIRYKFITNDGWTFIWMNSMTLTSVTIIIKTKKKVEIHEINGWENIFQNEIIIETNNSHKNSLIRMLIKLKNTI